MRAADKAGNNGKERIWRDGADTFFFKGTNGRWQDVLSAEELLRYDEKAASVLTPACRNWLEQGRKALT
jgi:aryl sulfotransferase